MKIEPALTAEEWAIALHDRLAADGGIDTVKRGISELWRHAEDDAPLEVGIRENRENGGVAHVEGIDCHALAALALYGQRFGFTREDADRLRRIAEARTLTDAALGTGIAVGQAVADWLNSLAARIEALLPPEGK